MHFRNLFGSAALAMLAAFFASAASAQFQPPPYGYPPGGYRGVPGQDGLMRADPDDDFDEVEARAPAGAPYPYARAPAAIRRLTNRAIPMIRVMAECTDAAPRPSGPYGH